MGYIVSAANSVYFDSISICKQYQRTSHSTTQQKALAKSMTLSNVRTFKRLLPVWGSFRLAPAEMIISI